MVTRRRSGDRAGIPEAPAPSLLPALCASVRAASATNDRTTNHLVERLPDALWTAVLPGASRCTVRMLAGHIHNARGIWIKTLGRSHGVKVPASVERGRVSRSRLDRALESSGRGIAALLDPGLENGGQIPPTPAYVGRNLPLGVGHVLSYFVAHEGHHRGQIVMLARQLGHRLFRRGDSRALPVGEALGGSD